MIRQAVPEDMPAIMGIERACFSRPWSENGMMFELTSPDAALLVAEEEGTLAGFSVVHRFCDDGELFNIAVAETHRRRGIGRQLLDGALDAARSMGIRRIYLEVRRSNATARALYADCGFSVCGERRNYYDAPREDAILMDADI